MFSITSKTHLDDAKDEKIIFNILHTGNEWAVDFLKSLSREELNTIDIVLDNNIKKTCVLLTTYKNKENEIGFIFDTDSFLNGDLPWVRAYFKSPKRFVIGGKGSCQHVYVDGVMDEKGEYLPTNFRKSEVKGKQALMHSISTVIQELVNWENGFGHHFEAFDSHIFVQSYKSLEGYLTDEEKKQLSGAFSIVAERLVESYLTVFGERYNDKTLENSRLGTLTLLHKKIVEMETFEFAAMHYINNFKGFCDKNEELIEKAYKSIFSDSRKNPNFDSYKDFSELSYLISVPPSSELLEREYEYWLNNKESLSKSNLFSHISDFDKAVSVPKGEVILQELKKVVQKQEDEEAPEWDPW